MASTIVPGNVLDGLDVSQNEIRGELTHAANDINALQGASYVTISSGTPLSNERVLTGTANEITLTDGGAGSTVTLTISNNPVLPGTGSVTVPIGSVAQRPGTPVNGMLRYNSDNNVLEAYINSAWDTLQAGSAGVTSLNSLTGALSIAVGTTGTAFNVSAAGATITLNLPDASATADGTVNTTTQTFAGNKTFSGTTALGVTTVSGALAINNGMTFGYNTNTPTTGQTVTVNNLPYHLIIPAGTLATLTLSLVSAPADGTLISIMSSQQITSLTVSSAGSDTVLNPPASLSANSGFKYLYSATSTTWYPVL